jgi:hypothetical protein
MGSGDPDADGVVGKVKSKAGSVAGALLGKDDSVADEDPDLEYEPTPDQRILEDGMVVLSENQAQQAAGENGSEGDHGSKGDHGSEGDHGSGD